MDLHQGNDHHESSADANAAASRLSEEAVKPPEHQVKQHRQPTADEISTGARVSNATAFALCQELGPNVPFDFSSCSGFGIFD